MLALKKALESNPLVYITRDIERALGLPPATKNYYIISNHSAFAKSIAQGSPSILLIKEKKKLDTRELLEHPLAAKFIGRLKNPRLLVFKSTPQIEKICQKRGSKLLNPSAALASQVEEKISQVKWLGKLARYLPPHTITVLKNVAWKKGKFVLQFNRAHTGSGTILITSKKQLKKLQTMFPDRPIRVTQFISGPMFTNNNIVWGKKVFIGNINYQITGLSPFTDQPFATIGNDWALPTQLLSNKQSKQYKQIVNGIGKKLAAAGWKGLFGVDIIMDEKTGKLYLIEINARQPASTTFESQLQRSVISNGVQRSEKSLSKSTIRQRSLAPTSVGGLARDDNKKLTVFESHLAALLELSANNYQLIPISDGAQIIKRVPPLSLRAKRSNPLSAEKIKRLKDYKIIEYNNTKPGEDLLRIQSEHGIMLNDKMFNRIGKSILSSLK